MINSICSAITNRLPTFRSLPKYDNISLKALAILGAFGTLLTFAYYLHQSRVSIKKTDELTADEMALLTAEQVRTKKCELLVKRKLNSTCHLGKISNNEDSFYEALSQSLQSAQSSWEDKHKTNATPESLRTNIFDYFKTGNQDATKTGFDFTGIDLFKKYKQYVGYTASELTELRKTDSNAPATPYVATAPREGVILCNLHQFNLKIISITCLNNEIENDKELKDLRSTQSANLQKSPNENLLHKADEIKIQNHRKFLYNQHEFYVFNSTSYPTCSSYSTMCTLAFYENHFVPMLTNA
ncbi:MAG: hypothetical protein ACRDFB_05700 [Rhabdochlamydiaceae bacterium]